MRYISTILLSCGVVGLLMATTVGQTVAASPPPALPSLASLGLFPQLLPEPPTRSTWTRYARQQHRALAAVNGTTLRSGCRVTVVANRAWDALWSRPPQVCTIVVNRTTSRGPDRVMMDAISASWFMPSPLGYFHQEIPLASEGIGIPA